MSINPYYFEYELLPVLSVFIGVYLVIWLVIMAAVSVVMGIGPYKMSKNAGMPHAWLAFIPVGGSYCIGRLGDRAKSFYTGYPAHFARWLIILPSVALGSGILLIIFAFTELYFLMGITAVLTWGCSIAAAVVQFCALYQIYKDYTPGDEVLFTVLAVLVSVSIPIILIINSNVVPVSVAGYRPYGQPKYNRPDTQYYPPQYGPDYQQPGPQQPGDGGQGGPERHQ